MHNTQLYVWIGYRDIIRYRCFTGIVYVQQTCGLNTLSYFSIIYVHVANYIQIIAILYIVIGLNMLLRFNMSGMDFPLETVMGLGSVYEHWSDLMRWMSREKNVDHIDVAVIKGVPVPRPRIGR